MKRKNSKRLATVIALLVGGTFLGVTGASAAPKATLNSAVGAPISALSMDVAEGGGGTTYVPPLTTGEIITDAGAVIRNAGGGGVLIRILDVIIRTVRVCPQCFIP